MIVLIGAIGVIGLAAFGVSVFLFVTIPSESRKVGVSKEEYLYDILPAMLAGLFVSAMLLGIVGAAIPTML